jgi:hypothetical protein
MIARLALVGLILMWSGLGYAQGWKQAREDLDQLRETGKFRIFYTLKGAHAFPLEAPVDERKALATAFLDSLIDQLTKADEHFSKDLGLTSPLESRRYSGATSIDIHIMFLKDNSGSAGDELHRFRYKHFRASPNALTIALSNRWKPNGITPAHELFHLYQYGYTFFKTSWYLEGMARVSEDFFRITPNKPPPLPDSALAVADETRRSYGASGLWSRLWAICGNQFFSHVLDEFKNLDQIAALDRGIDSASWPEDEQRTRRNTRYMLHGLESAMAKGCKVTATPELHSFKGALRKTLSAEAGSTN